MATVKGVLGDNGQRISQEIGVLLRKLVHLCKVSVDSGAARYLEKVEAECWAAGGVLTDDEEEEFLQRQLDKVYFSTRKDALMDEAELFAKRVLLKYIQDKLCKPRRN